MNKITVKLSGQVEGNAAATIPKGTIVRVIRHSSNSNVGDILIRTSSSIQPFVCLRTGDVWGMELENYSFEVITEEVKISSQ